jgi:arylsulfatase A-like enzyme
MCVMPTRLAGSVCAAWLCLALAAAAAERPNIVFILADDFGYGDLSSYGATKVHTPNIDRLAAEGRLFSDAHSPHPVCTPTRYSLMTGRYSWRTWAGTANVWSDDPLLIEEGRYTLPMLLHDAGYRTAIVGKWHLGFGRPGGENWDDETGVDYNKKIAPGPLEVGFDYYFGIPHVGQFPHIFIENHHVVGLRAESPLTLVRDDRWLRRTSYLERYGYPPRHAFKGGEGAIYEQGEVALELTRRAQAWLESNADEPFFLYFAHRNVHSPLEPNERFRGKSEIGVYGDFILELDWSVGKILETLDQLGVSKDTLVFFSSDNGAVQMGHQPAPIVDYNGHRANGPLRGQKTEAYEGGQRVPLLARWPGHIPAGSRSHALVALTDTIATLAELLDRKLPAGAAPDSFSYLPALLDRAPTGPVRKLLVHDSYRGGFGIREGDWKLLMIQGGGIGWNPYDFDRNQPYGQLYNLASDPAEQTNLYAQRPDLVERLSKLLREVRTAR